MLFWIVFVITTLVIGWSVAPYLQQMWDAIVRLMAMVFRVHR